MDPGQDVRGCQVHSWLWLSVSWVVSPASGSRAPAASAISRSVRPRNECPRAALGAPPRRARYPSAARASSPPPARVARPVPLPAAGGAPRPRPASGCGCSPPPVASGRGCLRPRSVRRRRTLFASALMASASELTFTCSSAASAFALDTISSGFLTGTRDDLFAGIAGALQQAAHLLLGLLERVRHRRPRRGAHLELGDHAVDALHVRLDRVTVVAAHGDRKGDVQKIGRHVAPGLAKAGLRLGRRSRFVGRAFVAARGRLVAHG